MTSPVPDLVYKITTADAWNDAVVRGAYAGSADDLRDGYIHLSAAHQLSATAKKYFSGVEGLVLIAVTVATVGASLRWERSRGGDLFPHYYGELPVSAAAWVRPLPLDVSGAPTIETAMSIPP
jgi:uncharacterized protein (DUF952 family)